MKIILGLDDFKKAHQEAKLIGKWESWYKNYYLKYKNVFDAQLKNLYMSDLTLFKSFVDNLDFKEVINEVEKLVKDGYIERATDIIKLSQEGLGYIKDYNVYMLIGFGHVNGTAFMSDLPYLYLGLETLKYIDFEYLIPHEFNHMVRIDSDSDYYKKGIREISVGECMLFEGIGTLYPMILFNVQAQDKDELMRKALLVREDTYQLLKKNKNKYLNQLIKIKNEKMNSEYWRTYFIHNSDERIEGEPTKVGYFIGCLIGLELLDKGCSIEKITRMRGSEIISEYMKIVEYNIC